MSDQADRLYEQLLVLRCQANAGDGAAFAELMNRFGPRLRYYVRKMVGDDHRMEDVLQEVWFDVYRGLPRLADPGALTAWLYRIARDRIFRDLRKRCLIHGNLEAIDVPADAVDEGEFTAEDAAGIHAALDELAPEHREVLVLRFLEEMTYEDIARVAGCLVGTVRSRLHYAKRALRRILERTADHE
jgi:RNA polymerase sigma-70 factor (ECF subfamily)